jgi:protein-tyrosine kinase
MDRFRTALQLYKDQQDQPGTRSQAGKAAGGQTLPRPIVYTRTRSLDIPLTVLRQRRVMAAYDKGPFVDAFKILRTQVMHRLREHDWNVLGVTSPGHGEGKTLTAVN